jgi:hypothetical protein
MSVAIEEQKNGLLCPSAPPDWTGATAIGLVSGTADEPRVIPLEQRLAATPELLALAEPVLPTEVFRFAADCAGSGCQHFQKGMCHLAQKVVRLLPQSSPGMPFCTIRASCRWFSQEGRAACHRCSQVVTDNMHPGKEMREAADPLVS